MKKIVCLLSFLLFSSFIYTQEFEKRKVVPVGDMFEVTIFYDNGNIMQHGFLSKDLKLHASWESYYEDGRKKCYATYNEGIKVGVWYYWYDNKITKVEYENNSVINVEDFDYENIILDKI
jgi:antitoxin component YwqK of YwqJK toxin-antitoxin module